MPFVSVCFVSVWAALPGSAWAAGRAVGDRSKAEPSRDCPYPQGLIRLGGWGSTDLSPKELAVVAAALALCPYRCLMHSIDLEAPSQTHLPCRPALALSQQSWVAALLTWPSAQTQ